MAPRMKVSKKRTKRQVQERLHHLQSDYMHGSSSSNPPSHPQYPVYNPSLHRRRSSSPPSSPDRSDPSREFFIQAYEIELVNDPEMAREVESKRVVDPQGRSTGRLLECVGLESEGEVVWADRFSRLHLVPHLPSAPRAPSPSSSLGGWSDLPSDAEDTFFFSGSEGEEYEQDKKRRKLDALRGGRLAALEDTSEKDRISQGHDEDVWGGSEEEPPEPIATLMTHTVASLQASPNPSVLELRILTNHGSDPRFAFLRGRWRRTWEALKEAARQPPPEAEPKGGGLGLLGGYGSDDESSGSSSAGEGVERPKEQDETTTKEEAEQEGEKEVEEARMRRREKAKAWAASRKAAVIDVDQ